MYSSFRLYFRNINNVSIDTVNLMIQKGVNDWKWGLRGACQSGDIDIIDLMIQKGADEWNWGLWGACEGGYTTIVNLMIEKGADDWNCLWNVENLTLYKLYIKKTGKIGTDHYNKLVCFYDPIYHIITRRTENIRKGIYKIPNDLWRLMRTFI